MSSDQFQSDLRDNFWKWDSQVIRPYSTAYDNAWAKYQATAADQEKLEAAQQELFATIVAIISTSAWMAAVADPALKRAIKKVGLRTLGFQNTRAILVKILAMRDNPIVSFAIGQIASKMHSGLDNAITTAVSRLHANTANGVSQLRPLGRLNELEAILEQQATCVSAIYKAVVGGQSGAQREALVRALREAPLMNPPVNSLNGDLAEKKILLGMYMQKVLDGDYTLDHFPPDARIPPVRGPSIDLSPYDKDYPKSETYQQTLGMYTTVEVDRPGAAFEKATDEAYAALYRVPFYDSSLKFIRNSPALSVLWISSHAGSVDELKKAEDTLRRLSYTTRPPNPTVVVV